MQKNVSLIKELSDAGEVEHPKMQAYQCWKLHFSLGDWCRKLLYVKDVFDIEIKIRLKFHRKDLCIFLLINLFYKIFNLILPLYQMHSKKEKYK